MIVQKVPVGTDDKSRKELVLKNLGKKAVIVDFHHGYDIGVILKEHDDERYYFKSLHGRELQFNYNDLEELHLIKKYGIHPVPEGFVKYPLAFRIYTDKNKPMERINVLSEGLDNALKLLSEMK